MSAQFPEPDAHPENCDFEDAKPLVDRLLRLADKLLGRHGAQPSESD